eukprot:gene11663-20059_t
MDGLLDIKDDGSMRRGTQSSCKVSIDDLRDEQGFDLQVNDIICHQQEV